MGVEISQIHNPDLSTDCNWWHWRATVEIIRASRIIDDERCNVLSAGYGEFSVAECGQIATYLRREFIAKLRPAERVKFDLSVTTEPDDGKLHVGNAWCENYSTALPWLEEFVALLEQTESGIEVTQ